MSPELIDVENKSRPARRGVTKELLHSCNAVAGGRESKLLTEGGDATAWANEGVLECAKRHVAHVPHAERGARVVFTAILWAEEGAVHIGVVEDSESANGEKEPSVGDHGPLAQTCKIAVDWGRASAPRLGIGCDREALQVS